jgi:hypothetical protein
VSEALRHDERDDYVDAPARASPWLDWLFAADSLPALAILLSFGLCLPMLPLTAVLAAVGVSFCRAPAARHHATLLLVTAALYAVLATLFFLDGLGLRIRSL